MAQLQHKYFQDHLNEVGVMVPGMELDEIVEALKKYKAQNPTKYAAKKEELFARYGLAGETAETVEAELRDPDLEELETVAKKVTRSKKNAA